VRIEFELLHILKSLGIADYFSFAQNLQMASILPCESSSLHNNNNNLWNISGWLDNPNKFKFVCVTKNSLVYLIRKRSAANWSS